MTEPVDRADELSGNIERTSVSSDTGGAIADDADATSDREGEGEGDTISYDDDTSESTRIAAIDADTESDPNEPPLRPDAGSPLELPKKTKWHDRKWLLAGVVAIAAALLGVGIAVPDRQAAKDEAAKTRADARSDAAGMRSDARKSADDVIQDANTERERLLGGVKKEKAYLLTSIESSKGKLAKVNGALRTARAGLASTERSRAQRQHQVDALNRAIRS